MWNVEYCSLYRIFQDLICPRSESTIFHLVESTVAASSDTVFQFFVASNWCNCSMHWQLRQLLVNSTKSFVLSFQWNSVAIDLCPTGALNSPGSHHCGAGELGMLAALRPSLARCTSMGLLLQQVAGQSHAHLWERLGLGGEEKGPGQCFSA